MQWLQDNVFVLWLAFVFLFGANVGSFLNMLVYRLPRGKGLWRPIWSCCPICGHKLGFLDNQPIFAWLWLRGKCRYCDAPISVRYPTVELLTALLFALVFWSYYMSGLRGMGNFFGLGLNPQFLTTGPPDTWPILVVHLVLVACLIAATLIDLEHFIIPLGLTWVPACLAAVVYPLATVWMEQNLSVSQIVAIVPTVDAGWVMPVLGAMLGLLLANVLLWLGWLPRGFPEPSEDEWQAYLKQLPPEALENDLASPEHWYVYPYPQWEVTKELLFVLFPVAGAVIAVFTPSLAGLFGPAGYPLWLLVLAGVCMGYLAGGLIIWMIRILGTMMFAKEAMGMGDVHLLAAIGACLGAYDAGMVMGLSPFPGLLFYLVLLIRNRVSKVKGGSPVIPYGPFLALGAILVMLLHELVYKIVPVGY